MSVLQIPWVEKFRPRKLKDVVGNEDTILRLRVISQDGNMPNLILSGPPGCGKTTSLHCLARALLGDSYKRGVLELNASDARTLDVVRNRIKLFAQTKISLPPGRHKIVILDEADSMVKGAQQALRRIMEIHSNTTRFAFACNTSSKIIEPIQSRCAIVRFRSLSQEEIYSRLVEICQKEKIPKDHEGLEAVIFCAEGDMRTAINTLQATFEGYEHLSSENVFKVCDQPHPVIISLIIKLCTQKKLTQAIKKLHVLTKIKGYSCQDIIESFGKVIRKNVNNELTEFYQLMFIKEVGKFHVRICEGVATQLQLSGMLARFCEISDMIQKQSQSTGK